MAVTGFAQIIPGSPAEVFSAYLRLRNRWAGELHSRSYGVEETRGWLARNSSIELWILRTNGEVSGAVVLDTAAEGLTVNGGVRLVTFMAAEPGKGVGSALLDFAKQRTRDLGRKWLFAWVYGDNHRAIRSYVRAGFRVAGVLAEWEKRGERTHDVWCMRWDS